MESTSGRVRGPAQLVLAAAILAGGVCLPPEAHAQRPAMPKVRELRLEQALEILREHGLEGSVQNPLDETPLVVVRQYPAEGAEMPRDRIVRLWVEPARIDTVPSIERPIRPRIPPSAAVVPDVRERPIEQALELLAEFDLEGFEAGREHSNVAVDLVIRQDPEPGTPIGRRRPVVRLWLSLGPRTVPEVRRLSLDEALAQLERGGFPGEVMGEAESDLPRGFVTDQDPEGGTIASDPELTVRLWLSTGPPPGRLEPTSKLTVPDVRRMPLRRAVEALRAAGLGGEVVQQQISELPLDFVVEQDPPGGTPVDPSDLVVRLVVSAGPSDPTGISPLAVGGIGLLIGLALGASWRFLRRRPKKKGTRRAEVAVIPRSDPGEQQIKTTDPLDLNLEIELRPVPDRGEQEIDSGGPLLPD